MKTTYTNLKTAVDNMEAELTEFEGGKTSRATNLRKSLQTVKTLAQELRGQIQEHKTTTQAAKKAAKATA